MIPNPLALLQTHLKIWCHSIMSTKTVHNNYSKYLSNIIFEILVVSVFLFVNINCESSRIFNPIPHSKSHNLNNFLTPNFITRPHNQNRMSSGVVQPPQTPIETEEDWPSFFPPYAQLDKILSFAEDVQTGFNGHQPQSTQFSLPPSSTSNSNFSLSGRSNMMMTSNPTPIYSIRSTLANQRQSLPQTRTQQQLNHRYGFPVPFSFPEDHSNSRFISPGEPADFLLKRKGGGGSPAWQNSWHSGPEDKYKTTTESSIEVKMDDDDEDTQTSTKYPYSEESEEDTTTSNYKKKSATATEDPATTADPTADAPTTLAPFTLNDIQIPVGFIRTEFMIGYCFLGLMYGLGFLVLFQSICVPIAKLFVFISYLWAVYFGVWSPISKTDAMQYLPPN